jgi:tellurite resistance protein TerC
MVWGLFFLIIVLLLALDLGVLHRKNQAVSFKSALGWSAAWITVGLSFSVVVYGVYEHHWFGTSMGTKSDIGGTEAVLLYLTAYIIEESLSVDNLFVIAVIFRTFAVDPAYRYRILFWGIMGALVMRALMIGGGVWVISHFTWTFYLFGGYLAFTGLKLLKSGDESPDVESTGFVRLCRRFLPIAQGFHGGHFLTREDGRLRVTMLGLVLLVVEGTDVIFALDSIPAVLAISTDAFIVYTSNIFAILGLRSLFFVLSGMVDRFRYLKTALSAILIFIGAKMLLHDVLKIPTPVSLAAISILLALGILASMRHDRIVASRRLPDAGS